MRVRFERGCLVLLDPVGAEWKETAKFDPRRECWVAEPFHARDLQNSAVEDLWEDDESKCEKMRNVPALRSYQNAAVEAWKKNAYRGCVELPTGAGKTRVALEWIGRCRGKVLVAVPTCVLLRQWETLLRKSLGTTVGIWGDGRRTEGRIVITTFASALIHLLEEGDRFDFLVVDEAHHLAAERTSFVARLCTAPARLGLSATFPESDSERATIAMILGPIVFRIDPIDLPSGVLASFDRCEHRMLLSSAARKESEILRQRMAGIFQRAKAGLPAGAPPDWRRLRGAAAAERGGLQALVQWRTFQASLLCSPGLLAAVGNLLRNEPNLSTLIFCPNTKAAALISARYKIPCLLSGISARERQHWLEEFRIRRVMALATCRVLNEGYDLPHIERCIVVGPSRGSIEYIQRIGRVLRADGSKKVRIDEIIVEGAHSEAQLAQRRSMLTCRYGGAREAALSR